MSEARRMTKAEQADLSRLIRYRERAAKTEAERREAELMAEFEREMATIHSYDQDVIWKEAVERADIVVKEAQAQIEARCHELGIPAIFAPSFHANWYGRGQNALKERRAELRAVARSRLAAMKLGAFRQIEAQSLEAQTALIAGSLTSETARTFMEGLPTVETLMPPLRFETVKALLPGKGRP